MTTVHKMLTNSCAVLIYIFVSTVIKLAERMLDEELFLFYFISKILFLKYPRSERF